MNERIKELAEQVDNEFDNPGARHKAIERFAELIVRECATLAMRYNESIYPPAAYVDTYILKEFGVEK